MKEKKVKNKNIIEHLIDAVTVLTLIATALFVIVGVCFNIVYVKTTVRGYSMYPTLNKDVPTNKNDGDVVFINKYAKYLNGDIVVANVTWGEEGPIVKRLIAGPGDIFNIKPEENNYCVYINGKLTYTYEQTTVSAHETLGGTVGYYQAYIDFLNNAKFANNVVIINNEKHIIMQENEYFLMGDNWAESTDCMHHGPVKESQIVGKVERIVPYGHGHIFAMIKEMFAITFIPNWAD